MIERPFWINRIERAWKEAPVVWLAGVRRAGKTTLVQSLGAERTLYLNCDLPVVADMVADPELFYRNCEKRVVVFDEIHQLHDPSRILKIGADLFPRLKIVATGSSTLAASRKFRDTLTGRKRLVRLTPVLWDELSAFHTPLLKRLYHGGLPEPLLAVSKPMSFYREWMDSFFARDIQRLFAFRNPDKFNAVFEYMMRQSGGLLEMVTVSRELGISRPTLESHVRALEATHALTLVRPFHGGGQKEVVKMPKAYGLDTGFVASAEVGIHYVRTISVPCGNTLFLSIFWPMKSSPYTGVTPQEERSTSSYHAAVDRWTRLSANGIPNNLIPPR